MIVKLSNEALDYAWGSKTLISDFFGIPQTDKPMAEIWFGTHHGSATRVVGSSSSLEQVLLEAGKEKLPFLLKILAAEAPLSIQAHPNPSQAIAGFEQENLQGVDLSDPVRNYKDDKAKPEMIVALSPTFEALVGFSDVRIIQERLQELLELSPSVALAELLANWLKMLESLDGIRKVFMDSLTNPSLNDQVISDFVDSAEQSPALVELVSHLTTHHGLDRGVISAIFLNQVTLTRGQAIFVPAGMPHAYLSGLGVEIMIASDNVLRGGLTPKHIDVEELSKVLVFESTDVEVVRQKELATGLSQFDIPVDEFTFYQVSLTSNNMLIDLNLPGDAVILCVGGSIAVSNSLAEREVVNLGEAAFISKDAKMFSLTGSGEAYLAISSN